MLLKGPIEEANQLKERSMLRPQNKGVTASQVKTISDEASADLEFFGRKPDRQGRQTFCELCCDAWKKY